MGRTRKSKIPKIVIWIIAIYVRLSKEDGNDESKSITNQKKMLMNYVEEHFPGCKYYFYIDDGLSGSSDDRPGFQKMIEDINNHKINCVIVKDLSRAFRNKENQAYYLEKVFPLNDIRFISLDLPFIDTYENPSSVSGLVPSVYSFVNEDFCAQTSIKIRNSFDEKRSRGEFIGAFATYGFIKQWESDHNTLIIDEEVAQNIRNIFTWYLDGESKTGIAKKLNALGVPSPSAYKKMKGENYSNPHIIGTALWSYNTINTILNNEMYIGNMVQKKSTSLNYKLTKQKKVDEQDWIIKENAISPIISEDIFDKVQELQKKDRRISPNQPNKHYLFSGLLRCADCKKAMRRKESKNHVYYSCRTNSEQSKTACTRHSIREDFLKQQVLETIKQQVNVALTLNNIIDEIKNAPSKNNESERLNNQLLSIQTEKNKRLKITSDLYYDLKSELISREQFSFINTKAVQELSEIEKQEEYVLKEIEKFKKGVDSENPFISHFIKYENIYDLEHSLLIELIDCIYVHEDKSLTIDFNYKDSYELVLDYISNNKLNK